MIFFKDIKMGKKKQLPEPSSPKKSIQRNSVVQNLYIKDSSKLNEYSSESSDDDNTENNTPENTSVSMSSRITNARIFNGEHYKATLTRAPIRRSNYDNKSVSNLLNYSDSESDFEDVRKDKICQILMSHRPGLGRGKGNSSKGFFMSTFSNFFLTLKNKLSFSKSQYSNNFSTSTNYISRALIFIVVIFFLVIFSVYFYAKFTFISKHALDLNDYTFIEDKSKLVAPICKSPDSVNVDCLEFESDRKPALNVIKEIKSHIDKFIYQTYCELSKPNSLDYDYTIFKFNQKNFQKSLENVDLMKNERDAKLMAVDHQQLLNYDYFNALKLIKHNPSWNMIVYGDLLNGEISLSANYSLNLPFQCRFKLFYATNYWTIISALVVTAISIVVSLYYRYAKHKASQEQDQVYDLIEKSMELLQSPDEPQSMPVLHIRDTLLSPSERKNAKYRRIWNKVVQHIENSESRVKVEYKKIDGEDFKAWKWIANTCTYLTDNETDAENTLSSGSQTQKIGGVEWQGQAFVLSSKGSSSNHENENADLSTSYSSQEVYRNKNFQALTCFIKIRNIFEKEAQYFDPNWNKKIKNTILEKTASSSESGTHDIVHIEIEDSPNEGLVYMKCASIAGATNAFHALHGWWCEKKLVSVKFLKEERYYQRFPHARQMNSPLKVEPIK